MHEKQNNDSNSLIVLDPKVMYTSHAPNIRAFMLLLLFSLVPGEFTYVMFMWTIFVFMFHIRCIYVDIYAHTCWQSSSSHSLVQFTYSKQALLFCRFVVVIGRRCRCRSLIRFISFQFGAERRKQATLAFTCHYV